MPVSNLNSIKELLDERFYKYNNPTFIESDPVLIPHGFSKRENIEISAFLTSTIAWGNRTSIIKNGLRLMSLLDNNPYDFVLNAEASDYKVLEKFCHRTFNSLDAIYFIQSLAHLYKNCKGLEFVFTEHFKKTGEIKNCLENFREIFFELPHQKRTEKHISDIKKNAACKRLNLFLRWMVRKDLKEVDFGLWKGIPASALYIPLDIHIGNVARNLGILQRKQNDWKSVEELTFLLRAFDPIDPIKYDYALFGMGVFEKFSERNKSKL
jgi:uncharacterized protein (TIGR02757 family)